MRWESANSVWSGIPVSVPDHLRSPIPPSDLQFNFANTMQMALGMFYLPHWTPDSSKAVTELHFALYLPYTPQAQFVVPSRCSINNEWMVIKRDNCSLYFGGNHRTMMKKLRITNWHTEVADGTEVELKCVTHIPGNMVAEGHAFRLFTLWNSVKQT